MRTKTVERSIFRHVNAERKKRGLPTLEGHPRLIKAARGHSRWMARSGTLSHRGKGRSDSQDRAGAEGYPGYVGENIWQTTVKEGHGTAWEEPGKKNRSYRWKDDRGLGKAAVITWMNSLVHRENLLSPEWDDIGIGVVLDKKGRKAYFTQCFGQRGAGGGFGFKAIPRRAGATARPEPFRPPRPIRRVVRRLARRFDRAVTGKPNRWLRRIWRRRRKVAKWVLAGAVAVYAGLVVLHLSNGLGLGDSLRGGIMDARVTAACFGDWGIIKQYVGREAVWGADLTRMLSLSDICP